MISASMVTESKLRAVKRMLNVNCRLSCHWIFVGFIQYMSRDFPQSKHLTTVAGKSTQTSNFLRYLIGREETSFKGDDWLQHSRNRWWMNAQKIQHVIWFDDLLISGWSKYPTLLASNWHSNMHLHIYKFIHEYILWQMISCYIHTHTHKTTYGIWLVKESWRHANSDLQCQ